MTESGLLLLSWWLSACLHGVLLVAAGLACERLRVLSPALREDLWRVVLLAPLLTAALQVFVAPPDWPGRTWAWSPPQVVTVAAGESPHTPAPAGAFALIAVPADAAARPRELPPAGAWLAALGWLWTLLAGARVLAAMRRWRSQRARIAALPAAADALAAQAGALACTAGIGQVYLRLDASLAGPAAFAPATIVLPPWTVHTLSPAQMRAALAHEIAHLARRDPLWQGWADIATRLLPPLACARRRLADLAEHACDAWAAGASGQGRALAEALAACAERGWPMRPPAFAVAMASPRSPLVERVQRLIEERPMNFQNPAPWGRALAGCALLATVLCLPGISVADAGSAADLPPPPQAPAAPLAPPPPAPPPPPEPPAVRAPAAPVAPAPPPLPPPAPDAPPPLPPPPPAPTPRALAAPGTPALAPLAAVPATPAAAAVPAPAAVPAARPAATPRAAPAATPAPAGPAVPAVAPTPPLPAPAVRGGLPQPLSALATPAFLRVDTGEPAC